MRWNLRAWRTVVDRDGVKLLSEEGLGRSSRAVPITVADAMRGVIFTSELTLTWRVE
jgi:hypothetical protein